MILVKFILFTWIIFCESRGSDNQTKEAVAATLSNRSNISWKYVLAKHQFAMTIPNKIYRDDLLQIGNCMKYALLSSLDMNPKYLKEVWYFLSSGNPKWAKRKLLILRTKQINFYRKE